MRHLIVPLTLGATTACHRIASDSQPPAQAPPLGHVVVVVLDGVRLEESLGDDPSSATGELPEAFMPVTWQQLVPQGLRSTETWSLASTTTAPAHVAMMTGRRLPFANYPVGQGPGIYRPGLPLVPEAVEAAHPGSLSSWLANTTIIWPLEHSMWPGLEDLQGSEWVFVPDAEGSPDPTSDDRVVLRQLQDRLAARPTRFALANLHQVDRAGHFGDRDDYPDAVRVLDAPIAAFWDWIQSQDEYRDSTWLLVMSDHGRHEAADTDPPWRHHGCSCNGCRRLPFLLLGPGVRQGQSADGPILLEDLAPTLAALLGVEMPWAEGLVRDDFFDLPTGFSSRSGVADFAVAGDLLAEVEYLQDPAHRTQLVVKGQRLSSPDAIDVAAPALARDGEQAFLCWREVELTPLEAETVWRPRCSVSGDGGESWTSIAAPAEDVGPFWSTKLMVSDEGEMLAAYSLNPNGVSAEGAVTEPVEVDLARFDGEAWTVGHAHSGITFPTRADAVLIEGRVSVAVAGSNDDSDARDHRSIYLADVSLEDNLSWRPFTIDAFSSLAPVEGPWRVEHPALHLSPGGQLVLAASGFYEGHSVAILASAFGTDGWGQVSELALPARLEPELGPVWLDDLAVFPVYDAATDTASLCAGNATQPAVCLDSGSDRILHLEVSESTLYALVGREGSSWEIESWSASEFAGR